MGQPKKHIKKFNENIIHASLPFKDKINLDKWFETYGNRDRAFNMEDLKVFQDSLIGRNYPLAQQAAILATSAQEMDNNGFGSFGVGGNGALGYSSARMPLSLVSSKPSIRAKQITYVLDDIEKIHPNNWHEGGTGGPYIRTGRDGYNKFWSATDPYYATLVFNKSLIRPDGREDAWKNRAEVAQNMYMTTNVYKKSVDKKNNYQRDNTKVVIPRLDLRGDY